MEIWLVSLISLLLMPSITLQKIYIQNIYMYLLHDVSHTKQNITILV